MATRGAARRPHYRPYEGAPVALPAGAGGAEAARARLDSDVARAVLDNTAALVCIVDAEGRIVLFNRACEELSCFRAEEVLGRGLWETVVVDEEVAVARAEIPLIIASGRGAVVEGTWRDRRGGEHLISFHNTVLLDEHGTPDRMVCVGVDITEQRRAEERLRELAGTDVLTGLLNRLSLFDALVPALRGGAGGCGLLYCDLDGFKRVNDDLGHLAGDELLVQVAARLRAAVRTGDLVGRLGGDEFVVVCPGADEDALGALAARVRAAVVAPYRLRAGTARVGISIGASAAAPGTSADELLGAADRRMYEAKRAGARARPR